MNRLLLFLTEKSAAARRDLIFLAITFGLLACQFLGRYPLLEPDEGRYSEIPREMLERLDFITPHLNYVKYFEKPPLLYWMNALSMAIFGQNEFAARLPCALAGLLTILFTYWLGRKLFDRLTGLYSAIIIGSCLGFITQARIPLTDMPLTLCLTVSLGSFILAVNSEGREKSGYLYLSYAAAALAVLAKGLIGILFPGAIIFLFMLIRKRWRLLLEMRIVTGLALFFAIAAPWFILVSMRNPEFARFFFIHEHFERFLTKVHSRYQPFWYFIPVLIGIMLPWAIFLPSAVRDAWRKRQGEHGEILAYLAIWAGLIFLFFSKSSSKLMPYILPVVPPLALIIADSFKETIASGRKLRLALYLAVGSMAVQMVATHIIYTKLAEKKSAKDLALKLNELATADDIIASFGYDQTIPFYAKRRLVVVGKMGELEFGSKQGDQSAWFMEHYQFESLWKGDKRVFLRISSGDLESFRTGRVPQARIVAQNLKKVLVTNR